MLRRRKNSPFDGKLLDARILGVADVETSFAIERQAVRGLELSGFRALTAEAPQKFAVGGELLYMVVGGADPDAVFAVNDDGDWPGQIFRASAKAARLR